MSLLPPDPAAGQISTPEDNVCTKEHCFQAFDALYCSLTGSEPVEPQFPDEKYPLFVTWNTRSSRSNRPPRLRGCIGTFEPQPIREGLAEYALISAFKDSRFNRIEESELPNLECAISLLTDFEDASSYLDWTVGVHGIYITFSQPSSSFFSSVNSSGSSTPSPFSSSYSLPTTRFSSKRPLSATYLPDVASEQGWDKIEAIDSAIRKAGWDGRITEDLRRNVKLRRYQSRKCSVGWEEFVEWRKGHGAEVEM
ncbi:alport syndrome [Rickenella mellea]|uniref:Alport syndrome n=1 Tax=Rickenella mellea TaxID=50990 RepID=A0A4R5XFA2_9AGAM|nr:alport syndrome [Rickenella mellea]